MTEKEDWGGIDPELQNPAQTNTSGVTWWTAKNANGEDVQIEHAVSGRTYFCPECEAPMSAAKGEIRAHYFRHKPAVDAASAGCGGEGARHYRVKTSLLRFLEQVHRSSFKLEVRFVPEKRIGQDQPDIVVYVGETQILGIEIVDSNPPSREKRERWGSRLHEIHITKWSNVQIGNALDLAGLLLPSILAFSEFTSTLVDEVRSLPEALDKLRKSHHQKIETLMATHARDIGKIEENLEAERIQIEEEATSSVSALRRLKETQTIWEGSWCTIPDDDKHGANDRATWVHINGDSPAGFPQSGHFVLIASQAGYLTWGVLGDELSSVEPQYRHTGDLVPFRLLDYRRAKEFSKLLQRRTEKEMMSFVRSHVQMNLRHVLRHEASRAACPCADVRLPRRLPRR